MEVAGMVVGAASLAFQVFEGIVEAFEIFESASHADIDCESFRLTLRTQYARLYTWGAITGLADQATHHVYDRRMKNNRVLVSFILGELERLLKRLRKSELRYETLSSDSVQVRQREAVIPVPQNWQSKSQDIAEPPKESGIKASASGPVLTDAEWAQYESLFNFQSASGRLVPRAGPKGLGHAMVWLKGAIKIAKQPKRILWAVKDKDSFASDLSHVRELVDHLHECVNDDQMQIIVETTHENNLLLLQMAEDMKALQRSIETAGPDTARLSGSTLVETNTSTEPSIGPLRNGVGVSFQSIFAKLVSFTLAANVVDRSTSHSMEIRSKDRHKILNIQDVQDKGARGLGTLRDQGKVWIEWKPYISTDLVNSTPGTQSIARVEALAALLAMEKPDEFCVPKCIRYFIDTKSEAFGLVFKMPSGPLGQLPPKSLRSMFEHRAIGIQSRFAIAQQMSQCVLYLHAVNWLHKGIRSSSVLFFQGENSSSLGQVYISGFEYSRVVDSGSTTRRKSYQAEQALYIHPDYLDPGLQPRFKKTFDLYGLGIVLVELAYWKRIDQVLLLAPDTRRTDNDEQAMGGATDSEDAEDDDFSEFEVDQAPPEPSLAAIRGIRSRILDQNEGILDQVETVMGPLYRKAVYACVNGMEAFGLPEDKDQANPVVGTLLQHAFIREVVEPLRSVFI